MNNTLFWMHNQPAGSGQDVTAQAQELLRQAVAALMPPGASQIDQDLAFHDLMTRDDVIPKAEGGLRDLRRSLELTNLSDWSGASRFEQARTVVRRIVFEVQELLVHSIAQFARGMVPVSPAPVESMGVIIGAVSRVGEAAEVMAAEARREGFEAGLEESSFWNQVREAWSRLADGFGQLARAAGEFAGDVVRAASVGIGATLPILVGVGALALVVALRR